MPRRCAVCDHSRLVDIDRALATRSDSFSRIAAQFAVSVGSVRRHAGTHLVDTMAAAQEAQAMEVMAAGASPA